MGHHDRDRRRRVLGGPDCRRAFRHDELYSETDQFRSKLREPVLLALGKAVLEADIPPLDPAELPQAVTEGVYENPSGGSARGSGQEEPEAMTDSRLLLPGTERRSKEKNGNDRSEPSARQSHNHLRREDPPRWRGLK